MTCISTHVLDTSEGGPRAGVTVTVTDAQGEARGKQTTDAEGRITDLATGLPPGTYTLDFEVGGPFVRSLAVTVDLVEDRHYHVPLLTSGWSAVTYLGS